MLKCVKQAENGKKRGGQSKWVCAADLYRDAFIANCAAAESERVLISAPTTAEMIQQSFEQMARSHRERVAEVARTDASEPAAAATDAVASDEPQNVQQDASGASGAAAKPEEKQRASKGRTRWKEQIAGGRPLLASEVPVLGSKALSEYLRAMGATLTRSEQGDIEYLRRESLRLLRDMGVTQWSV